MALLGEEGGGKWGGGGRLLKKITGWEYDGKRNQDIGGKHYKPSAL